VLFGDNVDLNSHHSFVFSGGTNKYDIIDKNQTFHILDLNVGISTVDPRGRLDVNDGNMCLGPSGCIDSWTDLQDTDTVGFVWVGRNLYADTNEYMDFQGINIVDGNLGWVATRDGNITGISASVSSITGVLGWIATFGVMKDGVTTDVNVNFDSTSSFPDQNYAVYALGNATFKAGQVLNVYVGDLSGGVATLVSITDAMVFIEVTYD